MPNKKCKCGHIKRVHKIRDKHFGIVCKPCCADGKLSCEEICRKFIER